MAAITSEQLEDQCRNSTTCIACGDTMQLGMVVCWGCFKHRDNAFKYSDLELVEWLAEIGVEV